jgi:twitching motility two-component system response regulator PilG
MQFSETEVRNAKTQMREAVTAAKLGHKNLARKLLVSVVEQDPNHEEAWLWCAALAEGEEEAQRCLTRVLDINPNNQQALNALALARLRQAAKRRVPGREGREEPVPFENEAATSSVAPGSQESPGAVASGEQPVSKAWGCPLCQCEAPEPQPRCRRCGALLEVDKIDDLAGNRDADEHALQEAIQRLIRDLKNSPTPEAHVALATAYLNLNRSAEALPHLEKACEMRPSDQAARTALDKLKSRRMVLTVDDSLTVRKIVAMTLERFGYRVLSAADGMQALARLNEQRPDLILLDITMPRMDGYQVCKTIKQNPYTKQIPVLMLSGKDGFFDKVKGKLAGATDYLTKPFQEDELIKAVEKHMKSRV